MAEQKLGPTYVLLSLEFSVAFVLDEQVRRYQDLVKRTSDLRSYL